MWPACGAVCPPAHCMHWRASSQLVCVLPSHCSPRPWLVPASSCPGLHHLPLQRAAVSFQHPPAGPAVSAGPLVLRPGLGELMALWALAQPHTGQAGGLAGEVAGALAFGGCGTKRMGFCSGCQGQAVHPWARPGWSAPSCARWQGDLPSPSCIRREILSGAQLQLGGAGVPCMMPV